MNKYVRLTVTGVLLAAIGWKQDWPKVFEAFAQLNVPLWLAAMGVLIGAQLVSAARWEIFARQLGMKRTFWQFTKYYFIGMYFNLTLPTSVGGDVVRAWYLNGNSGRKLRAAAAVLLDRINGLVVLVAMACVAAPFAPAETPGWVAASVYGAAAAGVCGALAIAAYTRWGKLSEARKQQLTVMWEVVREPRYLVLTSALSLVVQLCSAAIVWLVCLGLGVDIPLGYYAVVVPMVSLATLLPSINGIGVRESACVLFLGAVGVPESMALTISILWFLVQVAVSVLGGFVYLFGHEKGVRTLSEEDKEVSRGPVDRDSDQGRARQLDRAA